MPPTRGAAYASLRGLALGVPLRSARGSGGIVAARTGLDAGPLWVAGPAGAALFGISAPTLQAKRARQAKRRGLPPTPPKA